MEGGDDECAIDGATTPSSVLQYVFGFIQIDDGFVELLLGDALRSPAIEFVYLLE